jgi:hypothetical protein
MAANQSIAASESSGANGHTYLHDLFVLSDEQILEIEPEAQDVEVRADASNVDSASRQTNSTSPVEAATGLNQTMEPPPWLAKQMKDPWAGEEARELWEGVQRAQAEAAEFKQVFEKPEAARTAAERARALDEFDAAYFGAAGKSAEETSTARVALAQRMLREDPTAFAEMVAAGVKALEEARKQGSTVAATQSATANAATGATNGSSTQEANQEAQRQLAAYSAFEKAANADLERSVGSAIERTLQQALPSSGRADGEALKARLTSSVRQEIEKALQGDRQLGEQVAQVLSARRFDETARVQVVRLINERAQQLVPSATKRVLHDWTQTTLATASGKNARSETAVERRELAPAAASARAASAPTGKQKESPRTARSSDIAAPRGRVDYRKLSDDQILEL